MLRIGLPLALLLCTLTAQTTAQTPPPATAAAARAALVEMAVHEEVVDGVLVRVVDLETQKPVPGAEVFVIGRSTDQALIQRAAALAPDYTAVTMVMAAAIGTRYRAGDDGQVRVGTPDGRSRVLAIAGDRIGVGRLNQKGPIEVYAVHTIDVQVRTADGKPAHGIPIGLGRSPTFDLGAGAPPASTDRDGRCKIEVDRMLGLDVSVGVLGALVTPPNQKVDLRDRARGVLEFTLPPCGQVRFILYGTDEKPATGVRGASLNLVDSAKETPAPFPSQKPSAQATTLAADSALFSCVPLGREVLVTVSVDGMASPLEFRGKGPTRTGELVIIEGRLTVGPPILSFRIVDRKGAPVVAEQVGIVVRSDRRFSMQDTRTDGAGRITVPLESVDIKSLHVLRRRASAAPEYLGAAHREFAQLASGPADLGDLQLVDEPVAARGRLVDSDGKPIAGVWLQGSTSITSGYGGGSWSGELWFFKHRVQTGADGTFELRELAPAAQNIELSIEGGDWVALSGCEVAIGNATVQEYCLYRASTIAARFAGDDLAGLDCDVRIVHRETGKEILGVFHDGVLAPVRWAAGTYDLHIGGNPGFSMENVKAPADGDVNDPRLSAIAVPDDLCLVRVTAVNDHDQPVPNVLVRHSRVDAKGHFLTANRTDANGRSVVLLAKKGSEIQIGGAGFVEQTFTELTPTMHVKVQAIAPFVAKFVGLPATTGGLGFTTMWTTADRTSSLMGEWNGDQVTAQLTKPGMWRLSLQMMYTFRNKEDKGTQQQISRALVGRPITFEIEVGVEASEPRILTLTKEQQESLAERIQAVKDVVDAQKDK